MQTFKASGSTQPDPWNPKVETPEPVVSSPVGQQSNFQPQSQYPYGAQPSPHHIHHSYRQMRILVMILIILTIGVFATLLLVFGNVSRDNDVILGQEEQQIIIDTPTYNSEINIPLRISGRAQGSWFFDGAFPVSIFDKEGKLLERGIAIAQADWTKPGLVPFQSEFDFLTRLPDSKRGFIVFQRNNPSGFIEAEDSYQLPIVFSRETRNGELVSQGSGQLEVLGSGSSSSGGSSSGSSTTTSSSSSGQVTSTGSAPSCGDGKDNDGDGLYDIQDPECHTDGYAWNFASYQKTRVEAGGTGVVSQPASTNTTSSTTTTSTTSTTTSNAPQHDGKVVLYFPNENDAFYSGVSCFTLRPVKRSVGSGDIKDVMARTLVELMKGPTSSERSAGYETWIRSGTRYRGLSLVGRVAKIRLNRDPYQDGVCGRGEPQRQITETMRQFSGILGVDLDW